MDTRSRKALSWSVSIVVHAALLFLVGRAALNYALPEGEVNTDPTTFDVVGSSGDFKPVEPKQDSATAAKGATVKHGVRSRNVTPETAKDDVKFLPDKDFNEIKPAPLEDDAPQEVTHEQPPEAVPQNAVNEDEGVEKTENVPQQLPQALPKKEQVAQTEPSPANEKEAVVAAAAPPALETTSQQNVAPKEVPGQNLRQEQPANANINGEGNAAGAGGTQQGPPAYGPGTTIDITKLIEKSGNPKPYYPFTARFRHQEGLVILRAYIEPNGRVTMPSVEKTSGYAILDDEAVKAFQRWRYEPNQGGWALKPFQFNIKK